MSQNVSLLGVVAFVDFLLMAESCLLFVAVVGCWLLVARGQLSVVGCQLSARPHPRVAVSPCLAASLAGSAEIAGVDVQRSSANGARTKGVRRDG